MSDRRPPVQVVQCPKCGSPVEAAKPGAITSCSYCGSPLQLSLGASGHPIARLANIEASTAYLARAEQVRRLREQIAQCSAQMHIAHATVEKAQAKGRVRMASFMRWAAVGAFLGIVLLVNVGVKIGVAWLMALVAWAAATLLFGLRLVSLLDAHKDTRARLVAERDRLAARVAELEVGLDELAAKL